MNSEVYFTVKEMAEIIGYSKPTVQSIINKKNIKPDKIENNKYRYYSISKTIEIINEIKSDYDFFSSSPNNEKLKEKIKKLNEFIAKQKGDTEKYHQTHEKPLENTDNPDAMSRMLDMLQQELKQKDQQIMSLQDKLSAAYAEIGNLARQAQDLIGQSHYITAISATTEVTRSGRAAGLDSESASLKADEAAGPDQLDQPEIIKQSWVRRLLDKLMM